MPDEADISPGKPPLGDLLLERFFLKAGSAHEFEASVEMDADVNLVGRIGMLEMTATGTIRRTGTATSLTRAER